MRQGGSAAEQLYSLPLSRANRIVDNHSFRLVARVDPDHRHGLIRFIDEAMRLSLGNQGRIAATERVPSAGHETRGTALNDGNGLVIEVRVAGQRSSWSKTTISATNSLRAKPLRKEVPEQGVGGKLIFFRSGKSRKCFRSFLEATASRRSRSA